MVYQALSKFELSGNISVSQRLRNFVEAESTKKTHGRQLKQILALYYGSHCAVTNPIQLRFSLRWDSINNYEFRINKTVFNMLDKNDMLLIDYMLDGGLSTSCVCRTYESNFLKLCKKYDGSFRKYVSMNASLGKKTLSNLRVYALMHDFKMSIDEIKVLYNFTTFVFKPPSHEEVQKRIATRLIPYSRGV